MSEMQSKRDSNKTDEISAIKSTGDIHITESTTVNDVKRNFLADKKRINQIADDDDEDDEKDVIGCVHYKRRAKFVVSFSYH